MAELAMPDPAPLTSVSNPTGTANGDAISPSTSASDQPGLLVARICPYRGDRGARSSGPNEAIPSAANPGSRYHAVSVATIARSEEHTSELPSLMRISYDVFCLKKKTNTVPTTAATLCMESRKLQPN